MTIIQLVAKDQVLCKNYKINLLLRLNGTLHKGVTTGCILPIGLSVLVP